MPMVWIVMDKYSLKILFSMLTLHTQMITTCMKAECALITKHYRGPFDLSDDLSHETTENVHGGTMA